VALNGWVRGSVAAGIADYFLDAFQAVEVNSANVPTQDGGFWLATGTAQATTPGGTHSAATANTSYLWQAFYNLINTFTV
jgi:hypothetical protein